MLSRNDISRVLVVTLGFGYVEASIPEYGGDARIAIGFDYVSRTKVRDLRFLLGLSFQPPSTSDHVSMCCIRNTAS